MSDSIFLIGTSHQYQVVGDEFTIDHVEEFYQFLISLCNDLNIKMVAEEINDEGIRAYNGSTTIGRQVAKELKLEYLACDPSTQQRIDAEINGSGEVSISAKMKGLDEKEESRLLAVEEIKREKFWLLKLQQSGVIPILFICGAKHIQRFMILLAKHNYNVSVLIEDWEPNK